MSKDGIDVYKTSSILGYSLLPMLLIYISQLIISLKFNFVIFNNILIIISILWSTYSASSMFVIILNMNDQRVLVAYPIGLAYSAFAILAAYYKYFNDIFIIIIINYFIININNNHILIIIIKITIKNIKYILDSYF